MLRLWHKPDTMFGLPKACLFWHLSSPASYASPEAALLTRLFAALLQDYLNEIGETALSGPASSASSNLRSSVPNTGGVVPQYALRGSIGSVLSGPQPPVPVSVASLVLVPEHMPNSTCDLHVNCAPPVPRTCIRAHCHAPPAGFPVPCSACDICGLVHPLQPFRWAGRILDP